MMDWQQKATALNELADIKLCIRAPGDWWVSQYTEIKDGCMLLGSYGNGGTPEQAIEDHWNILTAVEYPKCIIANAGSSLRQAVRWNGYMWSKAAEESSPNCDNATGEE